MDLLGLWRGEFTPRKAAVLATQIPAGGQTWISCGYDNAWTAAEHLAALQIDALQVANWQRGGGKRENLPKPIQRPSDTAAQVEKTDRVAERVRRFAERQQATQPKPRPRDARGRFVKEA